VGDQVRRERARTKEALHQRTRQAELTAEIGVALTEGAPLAVQLRRCAEALVRHLDAAFARLWTCEEENGMLALRASAGLYTHLDGAHSRVPLGMLKIGRIAATRRPHLTNSVVGDPEVSDQEWARREGMVAFAGYPLVVNDHLVGVMALFARRPLTEDTLSTLGAVANVIALGIARTWADEERAQLLIQERAARGDAEAAWRHLHALFMQAPAIICVLRGPTHVYELTNPPYQRLIGSRDLLGKPIRAALPELAGQGIIEVLDHVYATGEPFVGNEVAVVLDHLGDGVLEEGFYNFVCQPIRTTRGVVEHIVIHAVEVTEQVRARRHIEELARQLRDEHDLLQQVVDLLPAAVVVTDAALTIQVSNQAVRALLGVNAAAPAPVAPGEAVPAEDAAAFAAYGARHLDGTPYRAAEIPVARAALRGEEVRGEQMLLRHTVTGRDLPILVNATPLRDGDGAITGGVVVFQDITALHDLERAREEFLSSVAHDLKTPLTAMRGQAQLARRRLTRLREMAPDVSALLRHVDGIEDATARMARLIDGLADVTRARLGADLELERQPTDLAALVRAVVARLEPSAAQRVRVEATGATLAALVDTDRIERVVENLLSNAVKYSPDGGTIVVTLRQEEGAESTMAVLVVQDTGLGIPPEDLPRVFERFHRSADVARRIAGTGVGLASVAQIVRQHGGMVAVESTLGVGSTFTVRLPMMDTRVGPAERPGPDDKRGEG